MPDQKLMVFGLNDPCLLAILSSRLHTIWTLKTCSWLGVGNDSVYVKGRTFDPFPFPDPPPPLRAEIAALAEELDAHRKRQQAEHPKLTLTQMYNVLEKLRAGTTLDDKDEAIKRDGLVLILKELHDRIDAKVAEAYGWPADLPDEEVLAQLVALNAERAAEERKGLVRWLRPDYQIPRFGKGAAKPVQIEADLPMAAGKAKKPSFPASEVAQNQAIIAALAAAGKAVSADGLAAGFKQGRKAAPQISKTLGALHRLGVLKSADRGKTFSLPR